MILTNRVNQCEHCLDLTEFNTCLQATTSSVGLGPTPSSVLKMIEGGAPVLANLKKIEDRLRLHLKPDGNWDLYNGIPNAPRAHKPDAGIFDPALVAPADIQWLPPIPDIPLFITFHGNGIQLWRDRAGPFLSHIPPRIPTCRLHPTTSLLGHDEPLIFPKNFPLGFSNELGVFISPGGKNIEYENAWQHIWGITNCNDATRSASWPIHFGRAMEDMAPHEMDGRARLGRASDAASAFGPWITTIDEVPNVLDLLIHCWGADGSYCRAHSSAYIMGPRNAIQYLSRFMTLPAGTGFQFGAPGQDGVGGFADAAQAHLKTCTMDMEHVGPLTNPIWCEDLLDSGRGKGEGYYGLISRHRGVAIDTAPKENETPFPYKTHSIWSLGYNNHDAAQEPAFAPDHQRLYEIFPQSTLSYGQAIELPAIANEIEVSCELACVIGPRQLARVAEEEVPDYLAGITIMIGLRDNGLINELPLPTAHEIRHGTILGRWYDGFNAARPQLAPAEDLDSLGDRKMKITIDNIGQVTTQTSHYLQGFGQTLAFMCKEITFLPGDIISLGTAGKTLRIPADTKLLPDAAITAEIAGLGEFSIGITDRRTMDKTN